MTLLRRTAQLVEDLRTLNVIKNNDEVNVELFHGHAKLTILWDYNTQSITNVNNVKNSLECEFGTSNITVLVDITSMFYCDIKSN